MSDASPASEDRYFDLSLRLLTIFVLVALFCCVGFLSYRVLKPHFSSPDTLQPESRRLRVDPAPPATVVAPAPTDQVLMDPRKTFKCEEKGSVTFSDRACDSGSVQVLPLNPTQPAPAGGR